MHKMTEIPIISKLKRENHKELAQAQDTMMEEIMNIENAVLHGGTAIWRCYDGERFSEYIDLYLESPKNVHLIFNAFEKRGLIPIKKKVTETSVYSKFKYNRVIIRFEALFKKVDSIIVDYRMVDTNIMAIYSLSPEQLIIEKVAAYINRLKIRDLYDIFFLLRKVKDKQQIRNKLNLLIRKYNDPVDEKDLKALIMRGIAPSSKKMIDYIEKWD